MRNHSMTKIFEEISPFSLFFSHSASSTTPTSVGGFDNIEALHSCSSSRVLFIFYNSSHQNKEWTPVERGKVIYDPLAVRRILAPTNVILVYVRDGAVEGIVTWSHSSVRHEHTTEQKHQRRDSSTVVLKSVCHLKLKFKIVSDKSKTNWSEFKATVTNQLYVLLYVWFM